jgi:hypothetical protein
MLVVTYLRAGEQWRALDALVNRVYGKPKETVVSEQAEPEWTTRTTPRSSGEWRRTARSKRVDDMTAEERDDLLRALTFQPRLRAFEPDEEAV